MPISHGSRICSINWGQLPFFTYRSKKWGLPPFCSSPFYSDLLGLCLEDAATCEPAFLSSFDCQIGHSYLPSLDNLLS